jgi:hypothetical protein
MSNSSTFEMNQENYDKVFNMEVNNKITELIFNDLIIENDSIVEKIVEIFPNLSSLSFSKIYVEQETFEFLQEILLKIQILKFSYTKLSNTNFNFLKNTLINTIIFEYSQLSPDQMNSLMDVIIEKKIKKFHFLTFSLNNIFNIIINKLPNTQLNDIYLSSYTPFELLAGNELDSIEQQQKEPKFYFDTFYKSIPCSLCFLRTNFIIDENQKKKLYEKIIENRRYNDSLSEGNLNKIKNGDIQQLPPFDKKKYLSCTFGQQLYQNEMKSLSPLFLNSLIQHLLKENISKENTIDLFNTRKSDIKQFSTALEQIQNQIQILKNEQYILLNQIGNKFQKKTNKLNKKRKRIECPICCEESSERKSAFKQCNCEGAKLICNDCLDKLQKCPYCDKNKNI